MFTMICIILDIAQIVGVLCRYLVNLDQQRILRYIKGTLNFPLCYEESESVVRDYVDSDFVGDLDKKKSTTRYAFTLCEEVGIWMSKLHIVVPSSITKVEFIVATEACKKAIRVRRLIKELGQKQ